MSNKTPKVADAKIVSVPKKSTNNKAAFQQAASKKLAKQKNGFRATKKESDLFYYIAYGSLGLVILFCVYVLRPALIDSMGSETSQTRISLAFDCTNQAGERVEPSKESPDDSCETTDMWLADTPQEQQEGLSNRESSAGEPGMFFAFAEDGEHSVWMKDMKYPLHLVWLNADMKIIDIQYDVHPSTYPTTFKASQPSRYLIELDASLISRAALPFKVGDAIYK